MVAASHDDAVIVDGGGGTDDIAYPSSRAMSAGEDRLFTTWQTRFSGLIDRRKDPPAVAQ